MIQAVILRLNRNFWLNFTKYTAALVVIMSIARSVLMLKL